MTDMALLVFLSKLPVYGYVIYKAFKYRRSLLIISANWLGSLGFFGMLASFSVIRANKLIVGLVAYGVVLSLFMITYTAKELKRIKE